MANPRDVNGHAMLSVIHELYPHKVDNIKLTEQMVESAKIDSIKLIAQK